MEKNESDLSGKLQIEICWQIVQILHFVKNFKVFVSFCKMKFVIWQHLND